MKRAFVSIILALVLVFSLVGCEEKQQNDISSNNLSTESIVSEAVKTSSDFDSSVPTSSQIQVESSSSDASSEDKIALAKNISELERFEIEPIPSLRKTVYTRYDFAYTQYSIVFVDDKKGIVDYEGNILLPVKYDEIRLCDLGMVVDDEVYFNSLKTHKPHGGHGLLNKSYYWDIVNNKLFVLSTALSQVKEDDNLLSTVRAFKVNKDNDGDGDYQVESLIGKYGFQRSGELITKLEFDCVHEFYDGLAAAKKDGLWGYIDENGKVAIDFQFDDISEANIEYSEFMFKETPPYDFFYGYAGVCKGGKWAYIDKTGKEVTEFNFYSALPVYKNKAWVCEQGYGWHVIDVK